MRAKLKKLPILRFATFVVLILILFLNGCTFSLLNIPGVNSATSTPSFPAGPTNTPQPSANINFKVTLPAPLPSGEVLNLSVVDELTGLGLNPVNYPMQGMDALHYTVNIPFALNSVIKYRYMRQGHLPVLESTSIGSPVRYRMVYVTGPGEIDDVVSVWADGQFNSPAGRITGQITSAADHGFIPDILVAAGGQQTLTDSGGRFILENLPAGTHTLVAYALNGAYQTIQQGARVEVGKTTQANLILAPALMTNVTFTLTVPQNTISGAPVRLAGNFYQLGDTFADLQGGLSTVSSRMPVLTAMPDGRYNLTLSLPVGADFRYKYTLGDGFWNAEHGPDGNFVVRQFIVPAVPNPLQVQDVVQTWQAGPSSPILFEVEVPANTPVTDIPSIQFNPYGWTEPIPLWPLGNNHWVYQLYSPLNMLGDFSYRYCRNDQCGVADDTQTPPGHNGRLISTSLAPQDLQDLVKSWTWFQPTTQTSQVGLPVTSRSAGFWAGVEFLPLADPTWQAWMPLAVQNVKGLQANWLVLEPTWTVSWTDPFIFSPVAGKDPLWMDSQDTISRAKASKMNVALFPEPELPSDSTSWWAAAPRTSAWWDAWFNRYSAFVLYFADLAADSGAQSLVFGGEWTLPALPGGTLSDGSSSGVPADAQTRWESLIIQIRQHFTGQLLWATTYPGGLQTLPSFANKLDGVYLLWYAPLSGSTVDELTASAGQILDSEIEPFQAELGTQLVIAAAYPSMSGAASASVPLSTILRPANGQGALDMQAQADIYQALLRAVNDRAWIGGFVSRGYYPPVALQDTSASIHGKPAADVLWYWYPRMLGTTH
jgi:hypothetical protein